MKRNVNLYIKDSIKYMKRAEEHIRNISYNEFLNDRKTCEAVVRCIEVIGEATKNIPYEIREKYPSIPWRDMAGMRDKIIHAYFIVDFEEVWLTVKEDIPRIKPLIKKMLKEMETKESDL